MYSIVFEAFFTGNISDMLLTYKHRKKYFRKRVAKKSLNKSDVTSCS